MIIYALLLCLPVYVLLLELCSLEFVDIGFWVKIKCILVSGFGHLFIIHSFSLCVIPLQNTGDDDLHSFLSFSYSQQHFFTAPFCLLVVSPQWFRMVLWKMTLQNPKRSHLINIHHLNTSIGNKKMAWLGRINKILNNKTKRKKNKVKCNASKATMTK